MGVVYKAEDIKLKRIVALKFLPPEFTRDPDAKQRLIHEARAASALDHPNICTIFETDETEDGHVFICMAYYKGETLKQRIDRTPMSLDEATGIALQIARGLSKAHKQGITHRDIKPANILITEEGQAKILDFGLAKSVGQTKLTRAGTTVGTVAYMSVEQARGDEVDHRSDIWSLGVVLYEMITGQLPFKGEYEPAIIYSILNEEPVSLTSVKPEAPVEVEWITKKAVQKDLSNRYQDIDELISDLKTLRKETEIPSGIEPPSRIEPPRTPVDLAARKKLVKKIALPAGAAVVLAIAFLVLRPYIFGGGAPVEPKPIAVVSFENQTGDPAFDYLQDAIPNLLITSLEQSRDLRVATMERLHDLLQQIGKPEVTTIDAELGFELCKMDGIEAVVVGSFTKAGDIFATTVKVMDVENKSLLRSVSSRGEGVGSILEVQIDELSKEIARGIGLAERKVRASSVRIAEATTSSMDAYNYFLRGRAEYEKFYYADALVFLKKAVELDSTFAVAHLYSAWAYNDLGNSSERDRAFEKAKASSKKVSDKEKLYIEAAYAKEIEDNPDKRLGILTSMTKRYPKEKRVHYTLASHYWGMKSYAEAIDEYRKALDLDPNFGPAINQLAYTYAETGNFEQALEYFKQYASVSPGDANPFDSMGDIHLRMGDLDDAIARYKEATEVKPEFGSDWKVGYVYALKEDYTEALRWIEQYIARAASPGRKAEGNLWKAFYSYWLGSTTRSMAALGTAEKLADEIGNERLRAAAGWMKGWIHYDRGELELSRQHFKAWYDVSARYQSADIDFYTAEYRFYVGLVDVKAGRMDAARSALAEMKTLQPKVHPGVADWIAFYQGILEGELLLKTDSLPKAVAVCENMLPWQLPSMASSNIISYNLPFLKDVLARAYDKRENLNAAVAEYERLVTFDRSRKCRQLVHPLYHYRLAKMYEKRREGDKAAGQYRTFLRLWQNADRGTPEVTDARQRVAALGGRV